MATRTITCSLALGFFLYGLVAAAAVQLDLPSTLTNPPNGQPIINVNTNHLGPTYCFTQMGVPHLYPTNYGACRAALEKLLANKPDYTYPYAFSQNTTITPDFKLPFFERTGTCQISLDTRNYGDVARLTLLDLYYNLMDDQDGIFKKCLGQGGGEPLGGKTELKGKAGDLLLVSVVGLSLSEGNSTTS